MSTLPAAAPICAVIFTMIRTAIENGLDPYRCLTWLLNVDNTADLKNADVIQALLF